MYFEENWYVILCVRLNCFHMQIMTSNVMTEDISDFEEGEIIDYDSPTADSQELSSNRSNSKKSCISPSIYDSVERTNARFFDRFSHGKSQSFVSVSTSETRVREFAFSKLNRYGQRRIINKDSLPVGCKRRRQRNIKRNKPRPTTRRNNWHRRLIGNERDRVRSDTPYEEKLKDFQLRHQKIRGSSSLKDNRTNRPLAASLVETENTGTSLLRRLVGSGSLCMKIHDENIVTEETKCNLPQLSSDANSGSFSAAHEVKTSDNANDSAVDLTSQTESQTNSLSQQLNQTENLAFDKSPNIANEAASSSLDDMDDEWKLRLEALRTAVLKKHSERLKRGLLPKKITSKTCDSIVDSFIEELEPITSFTNSNSSEEKTSEMIVDHVDDFNVIKSDDCSDMSMDSNYVSDEEPPKQVTALAIPLVEIDKDSEEMEPSITQMVKRPRLETVEDDSKSNDASLVYDMTDEELELRALALQSFLQKKPLNTTDGVDDDKVLNSVKSSNSKIEITVEKTVNDKSGVDESRMESMKTKDIEDWEELDEDILRAQLLKTLSAKLPDHNTLNPILISDETIALRTQRISVPSTSKKEIDVEREVQCRLWSEKMVPEFIISLNDSDSDSEPEPPQIDFVKSLDILLQEAKKKSENGAKSKTKKKVTSPKLSVKKALLKKTSSSTPVAVKHLPIQQQEEYRRLKLKLEEKMTSNPAKKPADPKPSLSKSVSNVTSKNAPNAHPRGNTIKPLPQKSDLVNLGTKRFKMGNTVTPKQSQSVMKPNTKLVNRVPINTTLKANTAPVNPKIGHQSTKKVGNSVTMKPNQVPLRTETKLINKVPANISLKKKNVSVKSDDRVTKGKDQNVQCVSKSSNEFSKANLKTPTNDVPKTDAVGNLNSGTIIDSDSSKSDNLSFKLSKNLIESQGTCKLEETQNTNVNVVKDLLTCEDSPLVTKGTMLVNAVYQNIESKSHPCEPVVESDKNSLKRNEISILSDKGGGVSLNKVSGAYRGVINWTTKENEGNSDKENDVIKNNKIEPINASKVDSEWNVANRLSPSTLGNESESDLVAKLREAQLNYEETLSLVKRLEMELQAAKRDLADKGRTVEQLEEKISDPSKLSTFNVNRSSEDTCRGEGQTESQENSDKILKDLSKDIKCAWDPDGVLCPFQLAGSCKDPLCSFHHIPTS